MGSTGSGATAPATEPHVVNPYTYAPPIASSGPLTFAGGTSSISAGTYRYDSLILNSSHSMTITGDVTLYVDKKFLVNSMSQLNILPGASLVIHHGTGSFSVNSLSQVNNLGRVPKDVQIWSATTSEILFNSGSDFYGLVYAPDAPVGMNSSSDFFGAIVGASLTNNSGSSIHYDVSLSSVVSEDNPPEILMVRAIGPGL